MNFLHADYTTALGLAQAHFDLLISLYAGPLWDHRQRYLKPRGLFLANTSHGDASLAALAPPRLELVAAVHHRGEHYRFDTDALDSYLTPKTPTAADPDAIRRKGRGIAYTRTAFAYLFRLAWPRQSTGSDYFFHPDFVAVRDFRHSRAARLPCWTCPRHKPTTLCAQQFPTEVSLA